MFYLVRPDRETSSYVNHPYGAYTFKEYRMIEEYDIINHVAQACLEPLLKCPWVFNESSHRSVVQSCGLLWSVVSCWTLVWCRQFASHRWWRLCWNRLPYVLFQRDKSREANKGRQERLFSMWPDLACHACVGGTSLFENPRTGDDKLWCLSFPWWSDATRRRSSGWPGRKCQGWTLTRPRWPCYGHHASS